MVNTKLKFYDSDPRSDLQLQSQSLLGDMTVVEGQRSGRFSANGKLGCL